MDEQDWSSADAARATRASVGGCFLTGLYLIGGFLALSLVVSAALALFD
jgi:hypothetical protein